MSDLTYHPNSRNVKLKHPCKFCKKAHTSLARLKDHVDNDPCDGIKKFRGMVV